MDFKIFLYLAVILLATKFLGIFMRKLGLPQVVGALLAGIIIGPVALNIVPAENAVIGFIAEIGVVMLMFTAGLETNISEIKKNGKASLLITSLGVIIPMGGGVLLAFLFKSLVGGDLITMLFFGVLLTATSVGITVEALRELGKLKGKVGTSILSAAVLDDIIGIIILSVVIGMKSGNSNIGILLLKILGFFVASGVLGVVIRYLFKWMGTHFPITRRLPILSLAICFLFAWAAEQFGIADITGAFIAGMMMSNLSQTEYVERKIDINSYMLFSPVFFASIGINMSLKGFTWEILVFSILLVVVGLITKIIGCSVGARICGFSMKDSMRVGYGMMARGEVGLIVAKKGVEGDIIQPQFMPSAIMLVVLSSLITPIMLKISYRGDRRVVHVMDGVEPPLFNPNAKPKSNYKLHISGDSEKSEGLYESMDEVLRSAYSNSIENTFKSEDDTDYIDDDQD